MIQMWVMGNKATVSMKQIDVIIDSLCYWFGYCWHVHWGTLFANRGLWSGGSFVDHLSHQHANCCCQSQYRQAHKMIYILVI